MKLRRLNMNHGQGASTRRKEAGLRAVFDTSLGISKAKAVAAFPYWHIDMNAGPGWNHEADCEGSPLVFLRSAIAAGRARPIRAYFCDINFSAIMDLKPACRPLLEQLPDCHAAYSYRPNAILLGEVARDIRETERDPKYAMGTLLSDPNGPKPEAFPLPEMAAFAAEFPRIDMALNLNLNVFRAVEGCKVSTRLHPKQVETFRKYPTVREVMESLGRRHWSVRNPNTGCSHHYMLVVGRNAETKRTPFKDFYPADSEEGRRILDNLKRQDIGQRLLFPGLE